MNDLKPSIELNAETETERIVKFIRDATGNVLKKRGLVVGLSGGIDSSVVTSLCTRAVGKEKVIALLMPDKDSGPDSLDFALKLVKQLDIKYIIEDITAAAEGFGCYRRRDEAVKRVFPEYDENYKMKIYLPPAETNKKTLNVFYLSVIAPDGTEKKARLPLNEYLQIVAASNFKQRSRTNMLYYHAEARNYAVAGTGNKNEHEQGFFVKYGDGGADLKPIAHLFKSQVYQIAEYLDIPEEIRNRIPTTDTYSAEQTQEEFFFKVPFGILDRIWLMWEKGMNAEDISRSLEVEKDFVEGIIIDIKNKIRTTEYLRMEPLILT